MNQSMHFYLSTLVGDAQQLIITTDNAKIPLDLSCSDQNTVSTWGSDDSSMHSRFSSYSAYSQTSSSNSMTDSSQGCRWGDSEGLHNNNNNASRSNNNGERRPKKPLRRPASPTSPTTTSTRSRSCFNNNKNSKKSLDEEDHVDHRRRRSTTVDCSGDDMFRGQKITLANAVTTRKGMLRMPQRRASNDGTRKMELPQPHKQQRRSSSSRNSHHHQLRHKRSTTTRNTIITKTATKTARYSILGEAIRELTMEEELAARGALTFTATRSSKAPQ